MLSVPVTICLIGNAMAQSWNYK